MSIKVMKQALEALEESQTDNDTIEFWDRKTKAITALQDAIQDAESYAAAYPDNLVKGFNAGIDEAVACLMELHREAQDGHNFYHVAANKVLELKEET